MIDHRTDNECTACNGTGKVLQKGRGGAVRTWRCACPAGRSLAVMTIAVTSTSIVTGEPRR